MRVFAFATLAALALVAVYLALGGASYDPAEVADPCAPRDWTEPQGLEEVAGQIVLSALDGAACELGVSREEIVLAFASRRTLERFAREHDMQKEDAEEVVRAGLERAVSDAERAGAISPTLAGPIRAVFARIPVGDIIRFLDEFAGP